MATTYGVNRTKNNAGGQQNSIDGAEQNGRVRWSHDSYEAAGVAKGSSVVFSNAVPKGAFILPGSAIYHDALGSNSAIAVGTAELGVELSPSEATTSAGIVEFVHDASGVDEFGTALTANSDIWVTSSGSGALTGTMRLHLLYSFR